MQLNYKQNPNKNNKIFVATNALLHTELAILKKIQFGKSVIENWPSVSNKGGGCAASVAMKERIKNRFV